MLIARLRQPHVTEVKLRLHLKYSCAIVAEGTGEAQSRATLAKREEVHVCRQGFGYLGARR